MTGGSFIRSNKIGRGNAGVPAATAVAPAGERRLADFGRCDRRSIDQVEAAGEGMAEICHCWMVGGPPVARMTSHGWPIVERSQALGLQRRLIAGLTDGRAVEAAQLGGSRRLAARRGAASPFRPAPGGTRVAQESRGSTQIQAQVGPDLCLKPRSSRSLPSRQNGSGPEAGRSTSQNGVGGVGSALRDRGAKNRSASRENGAEGRNFSGVEHSARAPFVERVGENCSRRAATVNASEQTSVENLLWR